MSKMQKSENTVNKLPILILIILCNIFILTLLSIIYLVKKSNDQNTIAKSSVNAVMQVNFDEHVHISSKRVTAFISEQSTSDESFMCNNESDINIDFYISSNIEELTQLKAIQKNRQDQSVKAIEERKTELLKLMSSAKVNSLQEQLSSILNAQLGKPYVWGGNGPDSFDCSGLVKYVYNKIGIDVPRVAKDQAEVGTPVSRDELQYGDLVFFKNSKQGVHHVGIYIGKNKMIHAPYTGEVVKIVPITGHYNEEFYKAIRLIK